MSRKCNGLCVKILVGVGSTLAAAAFCSHPSSQQLRQQSIATASRAAAFVHTSAATDRLACEAASQRRDVTVALSCSALRQNGDAEILTSQAAANRRTKTTAADLYFQQHGKIPSPTQKHQTLPIRTPDANSKNILVIGDVHGCFEDMMKLHRKAIAENDDMEFDHVILVGDLVNKGPESARVVRHTRLQPKWWTVRGNHDNAALSAALGHAKRRAKSKYSWVLEGEDTNEDQNQNEDVHGTTDGNAGDTSVPSPSVVLSDDDIMWMSELPYTLTIPAEYFQTKHGDDDNVGGDNNDHIDTVIVHAGFVPGIPVQEQSIYSMVAIREVDLLRDTNTYRYHDRGVGYTDGADVTKSPWASVWTGPQRVIFGHDARRGIQRYPGEMAIGIDSGAVYGNGMTAMILPERRLVSIPTIVHSAVGDD
uniref:Calcineurin-like phosphoesterase domain-containing protein n=1 Tax=Craspedostauros australis TaxID=1486917 RepID=A0A7R9ZPL6_9STRA